MTEKYVEGRYKHLSLRTKPDRPATLIAEPHSATITTYTVNYQWVTPLQMSDLTYRKVLPVGTVLAFDPASQKAVPNYTAYGFGVIGVLVNGDCDCGEVTEDVLGDRVVNCLFRGIVYEDRAWDNGTYGAVLQATKDTLAARIDFVKATSGQKLTAYTERGIWEVR